MNIEMIKAARERMLTHVRFTPLLSSPFIDELAGRKVFVKAEALQHTGSFKFRGAWSAISAMDKIKRSKGVLAFSSGNHAQGVALAARKHGIPATIIMPTDAPKIKIDNTRGMGAEIILYDRVKESREEIGEKIAVERGLTLIKPYDEPYVIAGQGTVGLEISKQIKELNNYIKKYESNENLILVTHYVLISEVLNYGPSSGEIVVSDKNFNIIGTVEIDY